MDFKPEPMAQKMSGKRLNQEVDPVAYQMASQSHGSSGHAAVNPADPGIDPPHAGEKFRCETCGMELQVTADCKCQEEGMVHFHCCGHELVHA